MPVVLTRYVRRRNGVDTDPASAHAFGSDALLEGSWDAVRLTGVATNGCVETTARTVNQLGYDVLVAADATSAKEESHLAGLESIGRAFGRVLPWRDALADLT